MGKQTRTSFKNGNTVALKHGVEAAVKAIQKGEPFTGISAEVEAQVRRELETTGPLEIMKRGTIRLQASADMSYNGMQDANERGDFEQLDRFLKRFGWLQIAANRNWAQIAQLEASANDNIIEAAITSAKGNNGNNYTD